MQASAHNDGATRDAGGRSRGRLGAYLAAGLGVGAVMSTTAEAGVVTLDVSAFGGVNGGIADGTFSSFSFTPGGGDLYITNNYGGTFGLDGYDGLLFASAGTDASPTQLAFGDAIGPSLNFNDTIDASYFQAGGSVSPNFGPGSYMAFQDKQGRYGYLEVTWDGTITQFQVLSGAYESVAGTPITAGAQPLVVVPEPSTLSLLALGVSGLLAARRLRATVTAGA